MRRLDITLAISLIVPTACAATGGPDTPEPVKIVVESGLDIGPCDGAGALTYPQPSYKGSAYFALRADAILTARHQALTQRQAPWLRRLDGPSGANRIFTAPGGDRILVFWACQPGACHANAAYGAYEARSGRYLLSIQERGATTTLGTDTAPLGAAIACARAHDERLRNRSAEALQQMPGR